MPDFTGIRDCVAIDGKVTIESMVTGKWIFRAQLAWRFCTPIVGEISTTIEGALENLEAAIQRQPGGARRG